jgi:putative oxidoreductase
MMGETMARSSQRLYVLSLGPIYERFSSCVETALRIGLGAILIPHGLQKLFGWLGGAGLAKFAVIFANIGYKPGLFWVVVVGVTEALGGLLLILGLFTRPAALAVVIFMLNAIWVTSAKGFFWSAGGFEYSLLILLVALYFLVRGGGACSLDRKLGREF